LLFQRACKAGEANDVSLGDDVFAAVWLRCGANWHFRQHPRLPGRHKP